MKWRQSVIYLVALLLVGGYFYYFEIVKKEEKETAEKAAKKVFQFQADNVSALDIQSKDKKSVLLKKEGEWKIVEPIMVDVDKPSVKTLLTSLANLESQREIVASAADLKPFGLEEPTHRLRFQVGDQWTDLLVGDKSPLGGGYYAKAGDKPRVVLIAESSWSGLNKGLEELRKRELFSFQTDEIRGVEVTWQDGNVVHLKRSGSGNDWVAPDHPGIKIKESKVRNVLEQVQWLRAQKFLEDEIKNLESYGLNSPHVSVKLALDNERTVDLKVAKKEEKKTQIAALSSELPAVVEVAADFLQDLPADVRALEDRSLFSLKKEEVKEVRWQIGENRGSVAQTDKDKWTLKRGDGEPEPLKDPWRVSSLMYDLDEAEYEKGLEPAPDAPAAPRAHVEFRDGEKNLQGLIWNEPSETDSDSVTLWLETEGSSLQPVAVGAAVLKKLEQDLAALTQPGSGKGTP